MTRILADTDILFETLDWTLDRYQQALEAGVLTERDRVELIRGKLIYKMASSELHSAMVEFLYTYFSERLGLTTYRYRSENPVPIPDHSQPEPDFIIADKLPGKLQSRYPLPAEVNLVIEVAKTSLKFDRNVKAELYAEAGISEYWIINLKARKIEVYTDPSTVEGRYNSTRTYDLSQSFTSNFLGQVAVADFPLDEVNFDNES